MDLSPEDRRKAEEIETRHDIEVAWLTHWKDIVCRSDDRNGVFIDPERVKAELYDYGNLLNMVSRVYDELTGGRISKPFTNEGAIIQVVQDYQQEGCEELRPLPGDTVVCSGIIFIEGDQRRPVRTEPAILYKIEAMGDGGVEARIGWNDGRAETVPYQTLERARGVDVG